MFGWGAEPRFLLTLGKVRPLFQGKTRSLGTTPLSRHLGCLGSVPYIDRLSRYLYCISLRLTWVEFVTPCPHVFVNLGTSISSVIPQLHWINTCYQSITCRQSHLEETLIQISLTDTHLLFCHSLGVVAGYGGTGGFSVLRWGGSPKLKITENYIAVTVIQHTGFSQVWQYLVLTTYLDQNC